jgi:hypothetical protein
MFETHQEDLLPKPQFLRRVLWHFFLASAGISIALGIGILGYHFIAGFTWLDALLNASMILGGMGPIDRLPNSAAKVFASVYALMSGLLFVGMAGLLLAPFVHRLMHHLHIEDD